MGIHNWRDEMKKPLTDRQRAIYDFIKSVVDRRGMPPTMREIGEKFDIRSTNGVEGHLAALEARGLIKRERGKSRGLLLLSGQRTAVSIPVLGRVAAGQPVLSPENREGEMTIDPTLFSVRNTSNLFGLKVRGESMADAYILDGDVLIIRSQQTAQNGEIVVALVDGEATVKRFFLESGRVRLQPENKAYKPIYVDRGDLLLMGKLVGLVRKV
jgi:repressor LexA